MRSAAGSGTIAFDASSDWDAFSDEQPSVVHHNLCRPLTLTSWQRISHKSFKQGNICLAASIQTRYQMRSNPPRNRTKSKEGGFPALPCVTNSRPKPAVSQPRLTVPTSLIKDRTDQQPSQSCVAAARQRRKSVSYRSWREWRCFEVSSSASLPSFSSSQPLRSPDREATWHGTRRRFENPTIPSTWLWLIKLPSGLVLERCPALLWPAAPFRTVPSLSRKNPYLI